MNTTWGSNKETFNGSVKKEEEVKADSIRPSEQKDSVKSHAVLFDNVFVKMKTSGRYIYAERRGVDSVAFILVATNAADERRIGLINEYKPPVDSFITTAFGGSIDNEKYKDDLKKLVVDEALEEAGFIVSEENVKYYGKVFVSSMMNQFCHLFAVEVDKRRQGERTTTDPMEIKSSVVWMNVPDALKTEDWKATTIIAKRLASKDSYAMVRVR